MPLEIGRLRDSDLSALSTGDEFKAAVLLWAASWVEIPASSIPADDRILAKKAGVSLGEWMGVKDMALRGWVLCSDGRFYHPLIADLAMAAFEKRKHQSTRAKGRWERARAEKVPTVPKTDAMAYENRCHGSAGSMQVEGDSRSLTRKTPSQEVRLSKEEALGEESTATVIKLPVRS